MNAAVELGEEVIRGAAQPANLRYQHVEVHIAPRTVTRRRVAVGLWGRIVRVDRNSGRAEALSVNVILKGLLARPTRHLYPPKARLGAVFRADVRNSSIPRSKSLDATRARPFGVSWCLSLACPAPAGLPGPGDRVPSSLYWLLLDVDSDIEAVHWFPSILQPSGQPGGLTDCGLYRRVVQQDRATRIAVGTLHAEVERQIRGAAQPANLRYQHVEDIAVTRRRVAVGLWGRIVRVDRNSGRAEALSVNVILKGLLARPTRHLYPPKARLGAVFRRR